MDTVLRRMRFISFVRLKPSTGNKTPSISESNSHHESGLLMLPFQSLLAVLLMLFDTFVSFAMDHLWVLNVFLLLQQIVLVCKAIGPGSTRHLASV